ncbi:MAG: pyridoxal-phosphate dependent enzyme, partial [Gammaproteobacteria bacterium]|nr:pyridoxal-phosphate dependent enzyme [Gammaproteobacteria bacterium]
MNRERLPADIVLAANRIGPHIRETPLDHSPYFSELTGANVYLKLDNLQHTGSFKLRGAFNKVLSLTPDER